MKYSQVYIQHIKGQLPAESCTTKALEEALRPVYQKLCIPVGQLESLTGITSRRLYPPGTQPSTGAIAAAKACLSDAHLKGSDLDAVIYASVCRDGLEPATACRIACALEASDRVWVEDISNACLGVLNAMIHCADQIELGHMKTALVVACESSRDILSDATRQLLADPTMAHFKQAIATFTGGSGAVAVLLSDGSLPIRPWARLLGGVYQSNLEFHHLCQWRFEALGEGLYEQRLKTEAIEVLHHGVQLGQQTWQRFLPELGLEPQSFARVICHQVGKAHQEQILKALGLRPEQDFVTYDTLGNMGSVALMYTAYEAIRAGVFFKGDYVGFLGIGSGLNCLMLAAEIL